MLNQEQLREKTDEELVGLCLTDQLYFSCLIKRYEKPLWRYIRRISNLSGEDAEDVLQEVFIKIYQNLNNFDPKLKFSSWAYRITHNEVISNFRKRKIRPQTLSYEFDEAIINNIASDFDIKKEMDNKFLRDNISKILQKLDNKYAQILILKYLENKTYQEISDILQSPGGTIATLLHRAKKKFAKELAKQNIKL